MSLIYPAIEPFASEHLAVGDGHQLYVEQCGQEHGIPALFLHGGPGAGCEEYHRQLFNPEKYRVVLFDQRGCGRSTPHASLEANTTAHLIADIERIREHLGIEKWLVFGGSWGSTLGLSYAQAHPDRVSALIMRGIFLCRPRDVQWFYQSGADHVFPDYWQDYLAPIPSSEHGDLLQAFYQRLMSTDKKTQMAAAQAWAVWEGRCCSLVPGSRLEDHFGQADVALALARIECHYFVNNAFMEADQLIRDANKLANIPGVIIHGRYDMVCPIEQAFALHKAWPQAELQVIDVAGHAASEPEITKALIAATDKFAELLESGE